MKPKQQTKDQLIAALRSMADSIDEGDSFEGSIQYTITGRDVTGQDTFDVLAFWRVGNSMGQGGSIMIGDEGSSHGTVTIAKM
jgi:hypothetical protein